MKSLPKYRDERLRLQAHLENQKQLIHEDMNDIKSVLSPLKVAKQVITEAADTFRDNGFATQTARLALMVLPRRIQHPLVGIAAQILVPMLARNAPRIINMISGDNGSNTLHNLTDKIPNRADILGKIRQAVSQLRRKIKPQYQQMADL